MAGSGMTPKPLPPGPPPSALLLKHAEKLIDKAMRLQSMEEGIEGETMVPGVYAKPDDQEDSETAEPGAYAKPDTQEDSEISQNGAISPLSKYMKRKREEAMYSHLAGLQHILSQQMGNLWKLTSIYMLTEKMKSEGQLEYLPAEYEKWDIGGVAEDIIFSLTTALQTLTPEIVVEMAIVKVKFFADRYNFPKLVAPVPVVFQQWQQHYENFQKEERAMHITEGKIMVFVSDQEHRMDTLWIDPKVGVEAIFDYLGLPTTENLVLKIHGKNIDKGVPLSDYNIKAEDTLELGGRLCGGAFRNTGSTHRRRVPSQSFKNKGVKEALNQLNLMEFAGLSEEEQKNEAMKLLKALPIHQMRDSVAKAQVLEMLKEHATFDKTTAKGRLQAKLAKRQASSSAAASSSVAASSSATTSSPSATPAAEGDDSDSEDGEDGVLAQLMTKLGKLGVIFMGSRSA